MITVLSPSPDTRIRRLTVPLYAYAFLDDLVLLYPVYSMLFLDTGLSVAEISSLFVIWSTTGVLLEIPSGALADTVSRRLLLTVAPLCGAGAFALWVAAPSYPVFAFGFVLWGVRGALQSGALEALVYEELDRLNSADRYATVMGRARAAGLVAVMLATAAAGPTFAAGGYLAVGAASVLACLCGAAAGTALPEHLGTGWPAGDAPADTGAGNPDGHRSGAPDGAAAGYLATLRTGLAEARHDPTVRSALLLVAVVAAVWGALEEYIALLARETGVPAATVPLAVLLVWAGVTMGGLLAGPGQRMTTRAFAGLVALAGLTLAAGGAVRRPAGLILVAAAFGALQLASVVADARLQERITGPARATVTSLAGLGTALTTIAVYAGYAGAAGAADHGTAFQVFAVPYLVIALWLAGGVGGILKRTRRQPPPGLSH